MKSLAPMEYSLNPHSGRSCVLPEMPGFPGLYQGARLLFPATELAQLHCSSRLHCAALLVGIAHTPRVSQILWSPQVHVLLCAEHVILAGASMGVTCCS